MKKKKEIKSFVLIFVLLLFIPICSSCGNKSVSSSDKNVSVTASKNNTDGTLFTLANSQNSDTFDSVSPKASVSMTTAKTSANAKYDAVSKNKSPQNNNTSIRKVILSGDMGIETNKFQEAVNGIARMTEGVGGFIENSNVTGIKSEHGNYLENRAATFTLRIPSSKLESFMINVENLGTVVSKTSNGEDITSQYYDSNARLKSQKIKETRLLDILTKTKTLADILAVETELESTRYQIETLTGTLKMWDNLIDFSTLTISLTEVYEKKPLVKKPITLSDKIRTSFTDSIDLLISILKGSLLALVALIPFIIIIGIIFVIVWRYIKRKRK